MPQLCVTDGCKYTSRVLCHCCKENLCRNHYNEHDYLNSKLNLLADEIDTFDRQLLAVDLKKYIQKYMYIYKFIYKFINLYKIYLYYIFLFNIYLN